ncbi:hypothetical protein [Streptomyces vastus]|uniref:Uncharacterized protein n=1 Tax=Streptomyces vastus TaxID=285451 RepID=A0ABN3RW98_9ACTN
MTAQSMPSSAGQALAWPWPVDLARYDRRGLLAETEADALRSLSVDQLRHVGLAIAAPALRPVARLVRPLADALGALHWPPNDRHQRRYARDAAGLVLIRCGELGRTYWGWSVQDWVELINTDGAKFRRSWGGQIGPNARPFLIAYAYLLGDFTAFDRLGRFQRPSLAHRVFGTEPVDDTIRQVCTTLADWGYRRGADRLTSAICQILLLNRSPLLQDLSDEALAAIRTAPAMHGQWGNDLHGIHRAVAALGQADPPPHGPGTAPASPRSKAPRRPGRTGPSGGTRPPPSPRRSAPATAACWPRSAGGWPANTPRSPSRASGPARPARPGSRRWTAWQSATSLSGSTACAPRTGSASR